MERYLGLDVHAKSCSLAVISESGRRLRDFVVKTNGQALVEALRVIPGRKHLCIEEGTQSAWLYKILKPHVAELAVAGVGYTRGSKSDKADAYTRAEEFRSGHLAGRAVYGRADCASLLSQLPPPYQCRAERLYT
jgi:hypothetical protein